MSPPSGKTRITIRLDDDVLQWFRARAEEVEGGSYQTMINQALRHFIARQDEPTEQLLRRVVREELARVDGNDG
ncbi:MAG: BrnA antitoxin family protein [Halobacteriales archaeon]|nr:BrnA antitoxin family protein [Halobacteriales archaeon]